MSASEAVNALKQRRMQGMTLDQLGKLLDVPTGTVQRWLKKGTMNKLYALHVLHVLSQGG